jgi:hypothetical protein
MRVARGWDFEIGVAFLREFMRIKHGASRLACGDEQMVMDRPIASQSGRGAAPAAPSEKCWICRVNDANSGEHMMKKSDLRDVLGKPTQAAPFYFHKPGLEGKAVGSLDADILKSSAPMCAQCNNARTQPHDRAWEAMSRWFTRRRSPLKKDDVVRGNRIFAFDTRRKMRCVHLFFLKTLGCVIVEARDQAPIDIVPFSNAILKGCAHPEVYLQFCCGDDSVGRHFDCIRLDSGHVFAVLTYRIKLVTVNVFYAQAGGGWENLARTWHPRFGTNKLIIGDYAREPDGARGRRRPIKHENV